MKDPEIESEIPFLCEVTSVGLSASELVAAVESRARTIEPVSRGIILGAGRDLFPETTDGVLYRLGVVYPASVGENLTNADIDRWLASRGARRVHPEIVLYLREHYSQKMLLRMVNRRRPKGSSPIRILSVWHDMLRDSEGVYRRLGLARRGGEDLIGAGLGQPKVPVQANYARVVLLP